MSDQDNIHIKEPRPFYWIAVQLFVLMEKAGQSYDAVAFALAPAAFLIVKAVFAKDRNKSFWSLWTTAMAIFALFFAIKNPFNWVPTANHYAVEAVVRLGSYGYLALVTASVVVIWSTFEWRIIKLPGAVLNIGLCVAGLLLTTVGPLRYGFQGAPSWVCFIALSGAGFLCSMPFLRKADAEADAPAKSTWGGNKPKGMSSKKSEIVVKFGNLEWDDRDFPRGWSITGETGSGKTEAAFKSLFIQLCLNRPEWGGVLVDQKGNLHEEMASILSDLQMSDKALLLKTRPRGAAEDWVPVNKFNLLSIPWIDDMTYAKMICDVAVSAQGGKGEDKSFFSTQALIQIASGIKLLRVFAHIQNEPVYKHVGLARLYLLLSSHIEVSSLLEVCSKKIEPLFERLISSPSLMALVNPADGVFRDAAIKIEANLDNLEELRKKGRSVVLYGDNDKPSVIDHPGNKRLKFHPEAINYYLDRAGESREKFETIRTESGFEKTEMRALRDFASMASHFNEKFLAQPPDQLGGVTSTIFNYLMFFNEPDVADVFSCEQNTFDFCEAIDAGKIIMLTMPQSKAVHRIFVNTTLKLLFYQHALSRFDQTKAEREAKNLIVLFADEAQGVVSKMEGGGFEDHAVADKIRQANATIVFAAQDLMSYETKIGKERSATLQLNLANKIVFKCATPESAEFFAKCFGKKHYVKKTGYSTSTKQGKSMNFQTVDEPIFKDHELNTLRKFEAVVKHCEHPPVKMILPPVDSHGNVTEWGKKIIKKLKT